MSSAVVGSYATYLLPTSIATKRNLSDLVTSLEQIDNQMTAAAAHNNDAELQIDDMTQDFLSENEFSLDSSNDRSEMIAQLRILKRQAPVIHMTFATEADSQSIGSLIRWFRESTHPQAITVIGFQPSLVAGAYIRTPNHIYDFSLKAAFKKGRSLLIEKLEEVRGNE